MKIFWGFSKNKDFVHDEYTLWEHIKMFFVSIFNKIKFTWQIWRHGWCDDVVFNLNDNMISFILPMMKEFRQQNSKIMGCPVGTEWEEYVRIVNQIIDCFEKFSDKENENGVIEANYASEDEYLKALEKSEEEIQKGFELFGKYFRSFWL